MNPVRLILVADDRTPAAMAAVRTAAATAAACGARLTACTVGRGPDNLSDADAERAFDARLDAALPATTGARRPFTAGWVRLEGRPAAALGDFARRVRADLIVVGCRGRRGFDRVIGGSTSEELVRDASCTTLIVPGDGAARGPVRRAAAFVTTADDMPAVTAEAARFAALFGARAGAVLFADDERTRFAAAVDAGRRSGWDDPIIAPAGADPAAVAVALGADLVVLGTRPAAGPAAFLLGPPAARVQRTAGVAVLAVPLERPAPAWLAPVARPLVPAYG